MPEMIFNGSAAWIDGIECELTVKGNKIATVSPPPEFGGKAGYCVPEEIFAVSLASSMNTIFILVEKKFKTRHKKFRNKGSSYNEC